MPETAQPASETDEKKSRGLGSYVVWAFVAVMVYVLSSGPAFWLRVHWHTDLDLMIVYRPLYRACEKTGTEGMLSGYWFFCGNVRVSGQPKQ